MTEARLPGIAAILAIAFCAGAGVLTLEVTAARVFIPWFGSSIVVWSNVIGVTLGAVAVGNLLGGRLADGSHGRWTLAALLIAAGVLTGLFPFLVPPLASRCIPEGIPLDTAFALLGKASLLVSLVALAPPLALLGATSPLLVRLLAADGRVGRAAGLVAGTATLGSLIGTWVPVHVLIPAVGSKLTCLAAAGLLLAAGAIAAAIGRGPRTAVAGVAVAGLVAFGVGRAVDGSPNRGAYEGHEVVEVESRYQYARVERDGSRTLLKLNEGLDSFHSLTVDGELLTGAYYDPFLLLPPQVARTGVTFDVLILGFAAGTTARQILAAYGADPALRIVGVELDPAVASLGTEHFALPADPRLEVIVDQDARVFVDRDDRRFELIVVDTYAHQVYVPFQACSKEFFATTRERLEEGGIVAANVGGFSFEDVPLTAIRNTAASVFARVALHQVPGTRNFVLLARRGGDLPDLALAPETLPSGLESVVEGMRLGPRREYPFDPDALVLTDDRSAIEALADRDMLARARRTLDALDR